jgi:AbrB family looped-hinge helix DNA binding protein
VPKDVRKHLKLEYGDFLVFFKEDDEILVKKGRVEVSK